MERLLLILLVIVLCLVLSFLFSGMESGVVALSRLRIRQLMRAGDRRASVLFGYLEQPENFLWTILVGNTLANFIAVGLIVFLLHSWVDDRRVLLLLGFLAVMFFFYTFCELLPKMLFRMFPNRLCLLLAVPFKFIHLALSPLVSLVTAASRVFLRWTDGRSLTGHLFGSREEMRLVMQESSQGLTSEERVMINRVLDLQNLTVREIASPMDKIVTVTTRTPMGEVLRISQQARIARLPVWRVGENNTRKIVGILNLRAILYMPDLDLTKTAGAYVKPALYLEEDMRLEVALKRMQRSGQRLAIVLGHNQRETSVVSLQDILKFIFGEVRL